MHTKRSLRQHKEKPFFPIISLLDHPVSVHLVVSEGVFSAKVPVISVVAMWVERHCWFHSTRGCLNKLIRFKIISLKMLKMSTA